MIVSNQLGTVGTSQLPKQVGTASASNGAEGGGVATRGIGDATSTGVSEPAQLMSKVSQLKQADPEQFKQVLSTLASDLRDASSQSSGLGAKMLASLANKLDDVADGGDVSQLQSPTPPQGGPPGPSPAGALPEGPPPAGSPGAAASDPAKPRAASAANAYRSRAEPPAEKDESRAALAKTLQQLDAALKATSSGG